MKSFSRFLLACAFSLAAMGAVACSDDSSSSASSNDEKKSADSWNEIQVFDAKSDLPNCDKFDGAVAQVIDEKAFFACFDGGWGQIGVTAPAYEQLPECGASLNDFCIDVADDDKIRESYVCDEGEWVKASKAEGAAGGCLKGDENGIVVEEWNYIEHEITL